MRSNGTTQYPVTIFALYRAGVNDPEKATVYSTSSRRIASNLAGYNLSYTSGSESGMCDSASANFAASARRARAAI